MAKSRIVQRMARETKEMVGRFAFRYLAVPGFFGCALIYATVAAAQHRPAPQPVLSGAVQSIVDSDTLVLRSGIQVRLVGIQAPKFPLGHRGFRARPLATEAKTALARLTSGKTLMIT